MSARTYNCDVYTWDCNLFNDLPHCPKRCAVRTHNYPPFEWPWCTTLTKLNIQVIFATSTKEYQGKDNNNNKVHDLYTSSYMTRVITYHRTGLNIQLRKQQEKQSYSTAHYHAFLIKWYKLETNKYTVYTVGDTSACLQSISYMFWPSQAIVMEFWNSIMRIVQVNSTYTNTAVTHINVK
jgi:hypothetical protein